MRGRKVLKMLLRSTNRRFFLCGAGCLFIATINTWLFATSSSRHDYTAYGIMQRLLINIFPGSFSQHPLPRGHEQMTSNIPHNITVSQVTQSRKSLSYVAKLLRVDNYQASADVENITRCADFPVGLIGRSKPVKTPADLELLEHLLAPMLRPGGSYQPTSCLPAENTAILIPYRDRWAHLMTLLPVVVPLMMRQNLQFTIFVIEQDPPAPFNKGLMFNVGFLEALKLSNFTCFILHDVDMLPGDDRNLYRCHKDGPVHLAPYVDKFNYRLLYRGLFGGVVAFTREQFELINGASNMYFGWGAEDDDLRDRHAQRVAVYDMIDHGVKGAGWKANSDRFLVFATRLQRQDVDGLNSAVYNVTNIRKLPLYTWINVAVDETSVLAMVPAHLRRSKRADMNFKVAKFKYIIA